MNQPCVEAISDMVRHLQLRDGAQLPSERELAARLGFSRNSVREALASLAALGRVEIRGRSGCFLRTAQCDAWQRVRDTATPGDVSATLRMLVPQIAAEAAANCTAEQSHRLEVLTARLGRHLVERNATSLLAEFLTFLRLLAKYAGSPYIELLLREIATARSLATAVTDLKKGNAEAFFALHVGLLRALQAHDTRRASSLASHYVDAFTALLDRSGDVDLRPRKGAGA